MALQERGDGFLVFVAVEGAGGVHQPAAGPQHFRRPIQYLCLPPGAARRSRRIPLTPRVRLAAEHALAGAGRIAEYGVKGLRPFLRQRVRIGVHHGGIARAHALQIGGEYLRPGGLRLIGDQQSLTAQRRGDLRTLAAGRSAQIQYALAGYGPQRGYAHHGAGLLQIERPRHVGDARAGAHALLQIVAVFLPRHTAVGICPGKLRRVSPGGIHSQGEAGLLFQGREKCRGFISQHLFHSLLKFNGQRYQFKPSR